MGTREAHRAAEHAARSSYGRLVALLAAASGDLQLAEDALSAALEQALVTWPGQGVPRNPTAWLLTVARNRQRDVWRSAAHRTSAPLDAALELPAPDAAGGGFPDDRLELLFVCAHPAIAATVRTPLVLSSVLGFEAAAIATAFAVPAATMAQRLVRAKRRVRDTRIRFATPSPEEMPERLPVVLEALYGCSALGWHDEARYLSSTLAELLAGAGRDDPEAWGLASFTHLTGPPDAVERGEVLLRRASAAGAVGRFQLEAAIAAVHAQRRRTGTTDDRALETLYAALNAIAPSLGSRVAAAAVAGRLHGTEAGLLELDAIGAEQFQPYWATRAHLLAQSGRPARAAYDRALALTTDEAARTYLEGRRTLAQ